MPKNETIRVGIGQFSNPTNDKLDYIRSLGVEDVILNMYALAPVNSLAPGKKVFPLSGESAWEYQELILLKSRIEDAGLRLHAIENIPASFYRDIITGGKRQKEQIENVKKTVANIGRAGITILGYNWMPTGVWRTSETFPLPGGALTTAFDYEAVKNAPFSLDREYEDDEIWDNYHLFVEELLPVAEEAGVMLALHPSDPPVKKIGGVPFLFRDFASLKRAMEIRESDHHAVELCLGTCAEMGENLHDIIRYFGTRNKIAYIHFRDVSDSVPKFHETFIGHGMWDPRALFQTLTDVGYTGVVIPDHVPHIPGDSSWGHTSRAYAVGYLRGIIRSI